MWTNDEVYYESSTVMLPVLYKVLSLLSPFVSNSGHLIVLLPKSKDQFLKTGINETLSRVGT